MIKDLLDKKYTWLVTGCAGFIGSHLVDFLTKSGQMVLGVDNLATGSLANVNSSLTLTKAINSGQFTFVEGDIRNYDLLHELTSDVDFVLHQAALGSVPRSIEDPLVVNDVNINGFLNILEASRQSSRVKNVVYAASSSSYGDSERLPKVENEIGNPLSPYAVTKLANEIYAKVYNTCYGLNTVGLRYFNVFGPRQDPNGSYAAVIPKWIDAVMNDRKIYINGDGSTSRDFCFISNVVQANIRAAFAASNSLNHVYNIAVGERTTLLEVIKLIEKNIILHGINRKVKYGFRPFREGDVLHSHADITFAQKNLNYSPTHSFAEGLSEYISWCIDRQV